MLTFCHPVRVRLVIMHKRGFAQYMITLAIDNCSRNEVALVTSERSYLVWTVCESLLTGTCWTTLVYLRSLNEDCQKHCVIQIACIILDVQKRTVSL